MGSNKVFTHIVYIHTPNITTAPLFLTLFKKRVFPCVN